MHCLAQCFEDEVSHHRLCWFSLGSTSYAAVIHLALLPPTLLLLQRTARSLPLLFELVLVRTSLNEALRKLDQHATILKIM